MVVPLDAVVSAPDSGFTPGKRNAELQGHVAFFDRDQDGIIWPSDTFVGLRDIHFNLFWATLSVLVIHGAFSYITWGSWIPDPCFRLDIRNMHRAKHGSDSGAYTSRGEFDEHRFDEIFDMYSQPPHECLSFREGVRMLHGNMNPFDPFGWSAAVFEWWALYYLLWPEDGNVRRSDVKAVYDGTLFYQIAGHEETYAKDLKAHKN